MYMHIVCAHDVCEHACRHMHKEVTEQFCEVVQGQILSPSAEITSTIPNYSWFIWPWGLTPLP